MRRFVCCLGALSLLVGAGLVLPGVASATNCDLLTGGSGVVLGYSISESTFFQVNTVNPESFACILPSTLSLAPDVFDLYNGPVANEDRLMLFPGDLQPEVIGERPIAEVDLLSKRVPLARPRYTPRLWPKVENDRA